MLGSGFTELDACVIGVNDGDGGGVLMGGFWSESAESDEFLSKIVVCALELATFADGTLEGGGAVVGTVGFGNGKSGIYQSIIA